MEDLERPIARGFGKWELRALLGVAVYCLGHWLWYQGTALGMSPALDGKENLLLARDIFELKLAPEPFFRAMLYPLVLAFFYFFGDGNVVWMASLFGVCIHVLNTILAMKLTSLVWGEGWSGVSAGLLVGFNPVLIHYAVDPLDITLGVFFFLGSLYLFFRYRQIGVFLGLAGSGACLALACLARPHFLAVAAAGGLAYSLFAAFQSSARKSFAAFASGLAVPLLAYALVNFMIGGAFAVAPWQGAYNLWVSNKPGANGLYYRQSVNFEYAGEHRNPNRLESEFLYEQATGEKGSIADRTGYWRGRTLEAIAADPWRWLGLMGWKSYALFNDWEQYNNKTFAAHKNRSPWLRFNPIGWGLLLVLGTLGGVALWGRSRVTLGIVVLVFAAYAGGLLLYMASGRFRVPLVALLAVSSGGVWSVVENWVRWSGLQKALACVLSVCLGFVAFSRFGGIADRSSFGQDYLLLADASAGLGWDREAIEWAEQAIELGKGEELAQRLQLISLYNLVADGTRGIGDPDWSDFASSLDELNFQDPVFLFVKGVAYWNLGDSWKAKEVWDGAVQAHGLGASASLAMLTLTSEDEAAPNLSADVLQAMRDGAFPLLAVAMERRSIEIGLSSERRALLEQSLARAVPGLLP